MLFSRRHRRLIDWNTRLPNGGSKIILLLVLLLVTGAFFVNILLLPGTVLPGPPYFISIVIAAYFLSPRATAGVAAYAAALKLTADLIQGAPPWLVASYFVALTLVGLVSASLAGRIRREIALAKERERLLRELSETNQRLLIASARQQELAEVAQRRAAELESVLDNMVDAVYVCDSEGRVILSNKAGVLLSGLAGLEEVKGELAELPERYRLRHLDGRQYTSEELPFARALRGEVVVSDDEVFFNRRTQRDLFVRVNAAPIRDDKGNTVGAVAVARDVTELMELDRLKDEFIEVAAHELKTPISGIRGFAQYLLRREQEELSPQGLRALQAINRQEEGKGSTFYFSLPVG